MINHKQFPFLPFIFSFVVIMGLLVSCSENKPKEEGNGAELKQAAEKYEGVTIELDISNKNCLSILLAHDGTINRKGSSTFDPKEKNFFIGLGDSKVFDSLMNEMPVGLSAYCHSNGPQCDTLKPTCKAKIAYGNNTTSCEIEYCVNGTFNDLPKPIRDFIERSVKVTEPWYQQQQQSLQGK
jgi:hypothetical protein